MKKTLKDIFNQQLFEVEQTETQLLISNFFGYHLVQLGINASPNFSESNRITHRVCITEDKLQKHPDMQNVHGEFIDLPFLSDSIDLFLLPHILDTTENFEELLKETWRSLISQGYIVILTFNKRSLWGLLNWITRGKVIPENHHGMNQNKLRHCLFETGFELVSCKTFLYQWPFAHKKNRFYEVIGKFLMPNWGGISLIIAKKNVVGLTPIKPKWQTQKMAASAPAIEPAARKNIHEQLEEQ